jgi:hypothetical protein
MRTVERGKTTWETPQRFIMTGSGVVAALPYLISTGEMRAKLFGPP